MRPPLSSTFLPGDSVMAVHSDGRTAIGTVRRATSRTLYVWFGGSGWGQRVWSFSVRDGSPTPSTASEARRGRRPTARLDLAWRSPFSGPGETDPAAPVRHWPQEETRDCLSLAVHGRTPDNEE